MYLIAICVIGVVVLVVGLIRMRRLRNKKKLDRYSIDPEALHTLIEDKKEVMVFDVRQPLDLLAHSEVIPGSVRIAPKSVIEEAGLIPKDKDAVIYCTCESEKTSREILERALALDFVKIKFLRGGLAAWKAKGYPVEAYTTPFHLDTAS